MDVVFPYKKTKSDELKYALRSLKYLPHRNVFICGDKPDWISDKVIWLGKSVYGVNAQHDSELNIRLALHDVRLSSKFILMNDDFFILRPVYNLPDYYTGTFSELIRSRQEAQFATFNQAMYKTKAFLTDPDPLAFEVHIPVIMSKHKRLAVSNEILPMLALGCTVFPRSIYLNRYGNRIVKREDVKLYHFNNTQLPDDFLSTDDGQFTEQIKNLFPEKCIYEQFDLQTLDDIINV